MSLHWSEEEYKAHLARQSDYRRFREGQMPQHAPLLEDAWQSAVTRLLKDAGYMTFHVHDSRRSPHGWPDVAAIKPTGGTLYLVELKTDTGQVTPAQQAWLTALAGCRGVVAECWRPAGLQDIIERLRSG